MSQADAILTEFGIPHECQVVSAHRTPAWMAEYASTAAERGLQVIIAGAGGAAHLPGMVASQTVLPVIGVPVQSAALNGLDSLLSIVQMPKGVPVATVAIGPSGRRERRPARDRHPRASRGPTCAQSFKAYRDKNTAEVRSQACMRLRTRTLDSIAPRPDQSAIRSRSRPGSTDRRPRRRAARPHVRDGGAPPRLSRPHARARTRHADRTDRRRRDQRRRTTTSTRSAPSRRRVDVVTFEFENVSAAAVAEAEKHAIVRPNGRSLAIAQHRLEGENVSRRAGLPVAPFAPVRTDADVIAAARARRCAGGPEDGDVRLRRQGADQDRDAGRTRAEHGTTLGRREAVLERSSISIGKSR